jgi:tRNA(Ile)-lysidine synthase
MDLVSKVRNIIEQERLIEPGERVLLGLSGGIDSTALLHVLMEIRSCFPLEIGVAHINHLLRGEESERDEIFVRTLAERFSVPCHVVRVDVKKEATGSGKSLQHVGRDVRYRFYGETALSHGYGKIGVAHTLDDQVETFILRMVKGTGMRGLSSIPMKRDNIVRPFLHTGRAEIESYVSARGVSFVRDSSNEKTVYERNFVRKQIIPWMEKLNPAFREKVFLLLGDLTAANGVFDRRAEEFAKTVDWREEGDVSLPVDGLMGLDEETRFRVMVHFLDCVEPGFIPLREHARQIKNVLRGARPNLTAALPHGIRIEKTYGKLMITKKLHALPPGDVFSVDEGINSYEAFGGMILRVNTILYGGRDPAFSPGPAAAFFDKDKLGPMKVRTFHEGDRFQPLGMKGTVKLKDFFMSRKIPREARRHIPLLLSGDDIIWVIGERVDDRYKATRETRHVARVLVEPFPLRQQGKAGPGEP